MSKRKDKEQQKAPATYREVFEHRKAGGSEHSYRGLFVRRQEAKRKRLEPNYETE